MARDAALDPSRGVYGISVAASLVGNAPQNLRLYETRGLVAPARSDGGTRLYSENDLARLRVIAGLLDDGLNLAGVHTVSYTHLDVYKRQAPPPRWVAAPLVGGLVVCGLIGVFAWPLSGLLHAAAHVVTP